MEGEIKAIEENIDMFMETLYKQYPNRKWTVKKFDVALRKLLKEAKKQEEKEVWKDIKGYEGRYQVSNTGKAKSIIFEKEKILKPAMTNEGTCMVALNQKGKSLARLVYETFTGQELQGKEVVLHKDKNNANCSLDNLYVVTKTTERILANRNDYLFEYYGEDLPLEEITKKTNIPYKLARARIDRYYWNVYEASEIPVGKRKKRKVKENE